TLQPGSGYTVSANLPGFQTITYTNVTLSTGGVVRQNFQLQVAGAATTVDVKIDRAGDLAQAGASVGDVLPEERISNFPLGGNNVHDLMKILPGVCVNGTGQWMGDYANSIAGAGLDSLNTTLDGLPTRDERFSAQAGTFQGVNADGTASGFFSNYTGGQQML